MPALSRSKLAWIVTFSAFLLICVSFGTRSSFGPMLLGLTDHTGLSITALSFAFSIQNLLWGAFQPFLGALADKRGAAFTTFLGMLIYGSGLLLMWGSTNVFGFGIGAAWLVGLAQSALGFPVVLGAVARIAPPERRSLMTGIVTSGASFGQLVFTQITAGLLPSYGTGTTLLIFAILAFLAAFVAIGLLPEYRFKMSQIAAAKAAPATHEAPMTLMETLKVASTSRGFILLVIGFFVCGFQIGFISLHLPAFAKLCGLTQIDGVNALSIVGGFNIIGTIVAGQMGRMKKARVPLAMIYLLRTIVTIVFLSLPFTSLSFQIFGAAMGILWLSTVPLTSEIVTRIFGPAYAGTLFGIAFFNHQIGSFLGVFLAGYLYDTTGNYDLVWQISMVLGVFAFLVHLPITEHRIGREPLAA